MHITHDYFDGSVTFELSDKRCLKVDRRAFEQLGVEGCLSEYGLEDEIPTGRVAVKRNGVVIGTVPATFDPTTIKSRSFLYDPRPGDFRMVDGEWIASPTLGGGDFKCIVGFEATPTPAPVPPPAPALS